jgi:FG-GAP-like repeat
MCRLGLDLILGASLALSSSAFAWADESAKSSPPDTTPYARPALPADTAAPAPAAPGTPVAGTYLVRQDDTVVNNTDTNLKNTDTFGDQETSIAINPNDRNDIVISAFSGSWGTWPAGYPSYAPLWFSADGGQTWTKEFTVTQPYGVASNGNCPCDQTYDYGTISVGGPNTGTVLYGTLLAETGDLYTGDIFNPALVNNWAYASPGSGSPPYKTNQAADSSGKADQPWMLYNRGPFNANAQDVYVAYGDFGTNPVGDRVAASLDTQGPPIFSGDTQVGTTSGAINPGHRLAKDPRNGTMWSLFQNCINNCANLTDNPKTIQYMLNRSTDQGATWSLNGQPGGILVSIGLSTQPQPKFGTVNALLGGVDAGAVDPSTGDFYYVWGSADTNLDNGLLIIRAYDNGSGGVSFDTFHNVLAPTSGVQAALPSVAITRHGTVGVFYYTYNGIVSGYPQFTTWLATSTDKGATFTKQALATFLSPATDNTSDGRQRVFGDYMQMKAIDNCFYGSYTGNGAVFGRSISNNDPIFFKACVPGSAVTHDFDGSGFSDIAWRDTGGNTAVWLMNGAQITSSGGFGAVPTTWQIVGQRDFDGDGNADWLWRDGNGNTAIWFLNGLHVASTAGLGNVPTAWSVAGTGDFNGDGKGDILWRDTSGNVAIWLMNGGQVSSAVFVANVPTTWSIAGVGDFDGDGRSDILWRDNTGNTAIWFMNGGQISSSGGLGVVPTSWSVAGTGDFDGDGKSDILWRDTSGNTAIWFMNGLQLASTAGLGNIPTSWAIQATGDFNSDGKSDILWRDTSGNTAIWFMNGGQISSTGGFSVPTAWTVQGLNAD